MTLTDIAERAKTSTEAQVRAHRAKRAIELEALAHELEEEAWEAGDLEDRLALSFKVEDLRKRAHALRVSLAVSERYQEQQS